MGRFDPFVQPGKTQMSPAVWLSTIALIVLFASGIVYQAAMLLA